MHKLIALEEQGWRALSTGREAAKAFYDAVLADEAVMVFPGGMLIEGKAQILQSIDAQPWSSFHLDGPRVIGLADNAAVVVYRVTAQRGGAAPYAALISSAYALRQGEWKLVVHQQTPA
jgi:hypothetical protein